MEMNQTSKRNAGAVVVPFPTAVARTRRADGTADEKRGILLFFTGVRYERMIPPDEEPSGRTGTHRH
jgi:hypothetical protein